MRAGADSRNVAAVGVLLTCVSGFGFYSLTVYESALTHAFSLGTVSRGSALFLLTSGLGGTVVGALLDRLDVRAVLAGGAACMAGGLLLLGSASGPLALYAAYLLLGLGQAGAGVVPGLSLITRWYDVQRRKLAMTLASTGLSLGGIAVAPLVARGLRHHPLGEVTTAAALVLLALCLSAAAAVTPSPTQQHSVLEAAVDGVLRAEAVRLPVFWLVSAAQTCATFAQVGGLTHLFALVAEHRSAGLAGEAVSCVALGSFSGRFLGGLVLARTSTATFYRGLLVLQAATLALLPVEHGSAALLATAALFGLTIGNVLLCHPLLLGELFGQRDFARVLSLSTLVSTFGAAAGPVVVGALRAATGSWTAGYVVAGAGSLLGAGLLLTAGREARVLSPEVAGALVP